MKIDILQLIDGARAARGLTVIIDVFRAFTLECYAFDRGVREIICVGDLEKARAIRAARPGALLAGEREGLRCPGFDAGNSPSELVRLELKDKLLVHTTSAGTQGMANAVGADELLTGSLVNAAAIARYIRARDTARVSLVCMGLGAIRPTEEDTLCAEYIREMIGGAKPDISREIASLRETSGSKFFDPAQQAAFPQADFALCTRPDIFDFVLKARRQADGSAVIRRFDVDFEKNSAAGIDIRKKVL